jgi:iron complex outermembrane recepter protein
MAHVLTSRVVMMALVAAAASSAALAQRTDDNVTAESDDAFGRSVGNERIGIYNSGDVRGFSPVAAGNVRIEGLYFDQQKDPTQRLVETVTIRVGIAAQSYPFPAPTGIVDYQLRGVGEEQVVSAVLSYGPFGALGAEVDAQFPIARQQFGIAVGGGIYDEAFEWGGDSRSTTFALVPYWRPSESFELRPFFSSITFSGEEPLPLMVTQGGLLPPEIRRNRYFGQEWAQSEGEIFNYGVLGRARFGEWTARFGVFDSVFDLDAAYADLFLDVDANGASNERVIVFPGSRFASRSGEVRLERSFETGDRLHTVYAAVRARDQARRYGGEDVIDLGGAQVGVGHPVPRPTFAFGPQSRDEVAQETAGLAYGLQWKDRGEFSVGVQRTSYRKDVETPAGALPTTRADPTLVNATATVFATQRLAVYASYTEGLEESPVAPDNAANRNAAAPALLTEQYDAGVRIVLPGQMKLVAGVFNVEKPYFDLDPAVFFLQLGTVEHRGAELSLAGSPLENLTVVAGTRYIDATVSGSTVDAGLVGRRPVGSARSYSNASADYVLEGTGLSFDATFESLSSQTANTANTVTVPGRSVLHLGGRYRFKLLGRPATLRAQVYNIFDKYGWNVLGSGVYMYNAPRRYSVYLAADL